MKVLVFISLFLSVVFCHAQQTIYDTITHDGLQRSYILYVPASYSSGDPAPLVINFHGYTSNSVQQMFYGDFRPIADTAGFLLVHPMGTLDSQGQTYWNANWGGTVDDIGFTEALIDSLAYEYNVNLDRVFCTGMSNGGFMSYTLACELSHRIAAIASVTGTMNANQTSSCFPEHPMPIMEIHGTADNTVPYNGGGFMESIENTLDYWVNANQCDMLAVITDMPDIDPDDGCSAEHHLFQNGNNGVEVEHYKIIDGGHTWPGAPFAIGVTNYDIDASEKIWQFFAKYDIYGRLDYIGFNQITTNSLNIKIYPNPVVDFLNISWIEPKVSSIRLLTVTGLEVRSFDVNKQVDATIPVQNLQHGIYVLQVFNLQNQQVATFKIIK